MKRLTKADCESAAKENEKKVEEKIILIPKINPVVDIDKWREAIFNNPMYIEGTDEQNEQKEQL